MELCIKNVSKSYKQNKALSDFSLIQLVLGVIGPVARGEIDAEVLRARVGHHRLQRLDDPLVELLPLHGDGVLRGVFADGVILVGEDELPTVDVDLRRRGQTQRGGRLCGRSRRNAEKPAKTGRKRQF